jgi:hypothetical protein
MPSRQNDRIWCIGLLLALHAAIACEPAGADSADETFDDMEEFVAIGESGALAGEPPQPCITPEEYEALFADVARNTAALGLDERTSGSRPTLAAVKFEWPLKQVGAEDPGYHAISNFVDHAGPGELRDTACGARTYDGHRGTDIGLWPFPWLKVETSQIEVVAAAPGTIVARADGNFDRRCSWVSGAKANLVVLKHEDGSSSYYYHMKQGSVTTKQVGDTVSTGERLGVVASSGVSTGPHLHFEVRDAANNVVDPFAGPCNPTVAASLWAAQRPYKDPAIVKTTTGSAPPGIPACPELEEPNLRSEFCRGDPAVFTAFFRDLVPEAAATMVVRRPDATVALQWQLQVGQHLTRGYYWRSWTLPSDAATGTWTFETTYSGQTVEQSFSVAKKGKACAPNK